MKEKNLAFHFIISEGVSTMKGCGRLDPFSIITYHLGLFSLAASSKRMGTLEGEASSELNIDKSWCVISVLIRDATQGQPVGWLALADCGTQAGLRLSSVLPTLMRFLKKTVPPQMFVPPTVWKLFLSLNLHSCCQPLCSTVGRFCQSDHTSGKAEDGRAGGISAGFSSRWRRSTELRLLQSYEPLERSFN